MANITTPFFVVRDDVARETRGGSSWRGVLGGAAIGLAIVGALIVGTRLAFSPGHSAAGSGSVSLPAQAPARAKIPSEFPPPEETAEFMSAPVIAATALPLAPPPTRALPPPAGVARARPTVNAAPALVAPKAAEVAPLPAPPATAAASTDPGPDERPPSLVPVIPASAPAEADPLVKAIQHDIEEDQTRGAK